MKRMLLVSLFLASVLAGSLMLEYWALERAAHPLDHAEAEHAEFSGLTVVADDWLLEVANLENDAEVFYGVE